MTIICCLVDQDLSSAVKSESIGDCCQLVFQNISSIFRLIFECISQSDNRNLCWRTDEIVRSAELDREKDEKSTVDFIDQYVKYV